jgi:holliday junction DNA helicase RuvA
MITRITGRLSALHTDAAIIAAGPFEYEVYIPEFVRRQLQGKIGDEVTLRTIEYLEGQAGRGNMTPRMIGFMSDAEREFFEAICSVDGVGVKKALRSMVRPVRDVAVAIEEQNIAKLRKKMTKFALMIQREMPAEEGGERGVIADAYDALVSLGHSAPEARQMLEKLSETGAKFKSVEDVLEELYRTQRE